MTDFETIPNKRKKQLKYEYHRDFNSKPLPADFIADQRRRSLKYTRKRKTIYDI